MDAVVGFTPPPTTPGLGANWFGRLMRAKAGTQRNKTPPSRRKQESSSIGFGTSNPAALANHKCSMPASLLQLYFAAKTADKPGANWPHSRRIPPGQSGNRAPAVFA